MAVCKNCGSIIKDGLSFCPECGAQQGSRPVDEQDPVFAAAGITVGGAGQYTAPKYAAPQPQYEKRYESAPAADMGRQNTAPQYQPPEQDYSETEGTGCYSVYSTGRFMGLILLQAVPVIGFIITVVFAFNGNNLNRRNFCRAILLWEVIGVALAVVGWVLFGAAVSEMLDTGTLAAMEGLITG